MSQSCIEAFFPTFILRSEYPDAAARNPVLLESTYAIRQSDTQGREWSKGEYGVGYTSYTSGKNVIQYAGMQTLAEYLVTQAQVLAEHLGIDLNIVRLGLTDMWVNINPTYSYHDEHLHGDSLFSGVYYVQTPANSGGIVFRDPRPLTAMLRPPFRSQSPRNANSAKVVPHPGLLLMFPAWLPHMVEQNFSDADRVSISYNFGFQETH